MKLQLSPRALKDIVEIGRYIRVRDPVASLAVQGAIRTSLNMLVSYPSAGRPIGRHGLHRLTVPRLPYLIFYEVNEAADAVQIVTVRHAARQEEN